MPDFFTLFGRGWKAVLGLTISVTAITALVLSLMPGLYLSTVTALPANSIHYDKGSIFNANIQELYSALGTPDELDKVVGTAHLDTLYIALVQEYNLIPHYKIEKQPALYKAVAALKKNSSVTKSEYGELKIKIWDEDPNLAAQLANSYFQKLQALHQQLHNESNATILQKLEAVYASMQKNKSLLPDTTAATFLNRDMERQYRQLLAQYKLMDDVKPPVLLAVETARAGYEVDSPKRGPILAFTAFASFLTGLLLAAFLESRKKK